MRVVDGLSLEAIQRGLDLPAAAPTAVVLGATDETLTRTVERAAAFHANAIDLRGSEARLVVDNGLGFLERVLEAVPLERYHEVRLAFAEPAASIDHLLREAIKAPSLEHYANRLERALLQLDPPIYQVRYQPVIAMSDRRIIGFESLLRATSGDTVIDAEDLIARAARGDWTAELDQLGRTLAVRGLGNWLGEGLLFLNVMAPGGSFDEAAVHATIDAAEKRGLEPDQIVLEAVERNRYTDLRKAAAQIESFRKRGVRIAVDDVGDGYAGLRVLSAFAPDIVKIAGQLIADLAPAEAARGGIHSLVADTTTPSQSTAQQARAKASSQMAESIIGTLVEMAHKSGAWVVAENIETERQFTSLTSLNVDWGQGLFLGAPAHR